MFEYFTIGIISVIIVLILFNKYYAFAIVNGFSMLPTFKNRDLLFIKRKYLLEVDKVYLIKFNDFVMLKRLAKIEASSRNGRVYLYFLGDNVEDSWDSRYFGWCDISVVIGEARKIF